MYKEHPVFERPTDKNTKIWRYLDFTEFVSLIDKRALFFTRVDKLGDPFEGSYSKANVGSLPEHLRLIGKKMPTILRIIKANLERARKWYRRCGVVNCWHMNEFESAAMWKLHLKSEEGVAVQSTFKRLADSFAQYKKDDVYVGKVKYIDYEKDTIPKSNVFYPFVHKRKSFEHEQELRALIMRFPASNEEFDLDSGTFDKGIYVPIDLNVLIERIFISPTTEEWFGELVESIMRRYGLEKKITRSDLLSDPLF